MHGPKLLVITYFPSCHSDTKSSLELSKLLPWQWSLSLKQCSCQEGQFLPLSFHILPHSCTCSQRSRVVCEGPTDNWRSEGPAGCTQSTPRVLCSHMDWSQRWNKTYNSYRGNRSGGDSEPPHGNAHWGGTEPFTARRKKVMKKTTHVKGQRQLSWRKKKRKLKQHLTQGKPYREPSEHWTLITPLMSHWGRRVVHWEAIIHCVLCSGDLRWRALCARPWLLHVGFEPLLTTQGGSLARETYSTDKAGGYCQFLYYRTLFLWNKLKVFSAKLLGNSVTIIPLNSKVTPITGK